LAETVAAVINLYIEFAKSRLGPTTLEERKPALREMIEAGRLSNAIATKVGDRIVTHLIEQDGPIAYSERATAASIDEEDVNRCLLLMTDESERQTQRILQTTTTGALGRDTADVTRIVAVHHAIQRMIPRVDVVVPFAEAIAKNYPT
jgi:hypothetical protein